MQVSLYYADFNSFACLIVWIKKDPQGPHVLVSGAFGRGWNRGSDTAFLMLGSEAWAEKVGHWGCDLVRSTLFLDPPSLSAFCPPRDEWLSSAHEITQCRPVPVRTKTSKA